MQDNNVHIQLTDSLTSQKAYISLALGSHIQMRFPKYHSITHNKNFKKGEKRNKNENLKLSLKYM